MVIFFSDLVDCEMYPLSMFSTVQIYTLESVVTLTEAFCYQLKYTVVATWCFLVRLIYLQYLLKGTTDLSNHTISRTEDYLYLYIYKICKHNFSWQHVLIKATAACSVYEMIYLVEQSWRL